MSHYAELFFRRPAGVVDGTRVERRIKFIPTLMMAAIAAIVALALVAEARMTPEQRLQLLESYNAYP
jgi:hypothetical protein